jgi:predicted Zn-dependent protease with MMP-like domain
MSNSDQSRVQMQSLSPDKVMNKLVSLAKRRGFIFPSSEIYGGLSSCFDYGPLGSEMKKNIKDLWWNAMTRRHQNIVGIDASIMMNPTVWEASGHVASFNDPMIDDKTTKRRYRADHLIENHIGKLVRDAIAQLPDPIRLRIEHVPVIVQDRPDREAVEQGFDPRSLGMFDGVPYAEQGAPALTRILVFQRNLEDVVENEAELEDEVYVTLLHETGHFFGLSEEDLDQRGLA